MQPGRRHHVGIDIGGTFTDLVPIDDETGKRTVGKVLSTPEDPSEAVENELVELLGHEGVGADQLTTIIHGTTLITNALIERKGATTVLLTTEGFRDAVAIGTEHRYDMYDRTRCPARGIQGGSPGAAGAVHTVGGEELHPTRQQRIAAEERLILSLPGGGGFGLATERDPDRVARAVTDGLVSIERAREVYGGALRATSQHGRYTVDKEATARLRAEAAPYPTNEP